MELHRLHALVHDRFSSALWRMDREYVGLYVRWWRLLHSILPGYCSDRQLSRTYLEQTIFNKHENSSNFQISRQVLNLFLALLLSNFGSSSLSAPSADQETNKIAEAFNRISRFKKWVKSSIMNGLKKLKNKITNQISVQPSGNKKLVLCVVYFRIDGWWFFRSELRLKYGNIRNSQFLLFSRVVKSLIFILNFHSNWTMSLLHLWVVVRNLSKPYLLLILNKLINCQHEWK